jgi:hypothetical protein
VALSFQSKTFRSTRCTKVYYKIECGDSACDFFCRWSKSTKDNLWRVYKCNRGGHTCTNLTQGGGKQSGITSDILAHALAPSLRVQGRNDNFTIKGVIAFAKNKFHVDVHTRMAYRALTQGREIVRGDLLSTFQRVESYLSELVGQNPGSSYLVEKDAEYVLPCLLWVCCLCNVCRGGYLRSCYILGAGVHASKQCLPVQFLDGAFMATITSRTKLELVGRDAQKHVVPIAVACVPSESKEDTA